MSRGKKYIAMKKKAPKEAVSLGDAVKFIQDNARKTFDETVELHINLGIDHEKSDQMVRGSAQLPGGAPTQKKIAVITDDKDQIAAAKKAGAVITGGDDVIATIESDGNIDADIIISTPNMMGKIAKVAKVLGPKGLMPNPKTGTVTDDPAAAVKELADGKMTYKMDNTGNIHEAIAKASWDADKITENAQALIDSVKAARPASQKGVYVKSVTLTSSMSPGLKVAV